jgi:hypothetical protein
VFHYYFFLPLPLFFLFSPTTHLDLPQGEQGAGDICHSAGDICLYFPFLFLFPLLHVPTCHKANKTAVLATPPLQYSTISDISLSTTQSATSLLRNPVSDIQGESDTPLFQKQSFSKTIMTFSLSPKP